MSNSSSYIGIQFELQVSFVNHVTPIPEGIDSDAAASILCAVSSIGVLY